MTSIKPPATGPTGTHTSPEVAGPTGAPGRPDAATSSSFQSSLSQAQSAGSTEQVTAATGGRTDPIADLARSIESGSLTFDQAVDQLVDRTLSRAQKQLNGSQLDELSGLLRDALLNDPTLSALRSERR